MAIEDIIKILEKFRDERDWLQFHNPKDLAIALNIESAELLEEFLWKEPEAADLEKIKNELADILTYAFYLSNHYKLDIEQIIENKIELNKKKYPVSKAKGNSKKYSDL